MLLLQKSFVAFLALMGAQARPGEIPGYSDADKFASVVDTTLGCTYSYNALYLKYVIMGEGWVGLDDKVYAKIKKAAKSTGAMTGWDQRNHGGFGGVEVEFNLPLGTNKKFAKKLNKVLPLASGSSVECEKVDRDSQVDAVAYGDLPPLDFLINPHEWGINPLEWE